jgi:hypothetical protein
MDTNRDFFPDQPPDAGPSSAWGLGFADGQAGRQKDAIQCRPESDGNVQRWTVLYAKGYAAGKAAGAGARSERQTNEAALSPGLYLLGFCILIGSLQLGGFLPAFGQDQHFGFHGHH